ncbi:uncharacterized protein SPAPADRAFT_130746 [Spathaspora passalidarum NRRL Y-27907]|uniref:Chromatin assembly factor 1 subunit A n=1 Tax=Spathaspora passalidarum (strain NRRL Y-27907 / 11-Y1) TaxID=619300 RepID=G3AGP7_SPAPN|nr:uncharacterized protein SPAPADRAFT_130746 [Spathaspora passalidarum NRRL Y-27907]EGW35380.1 hypothetical protein SPAPADRAFT_130746 [Spathaspora passalidarum NRRL Y-27907]
MDVDLSLQPTSTDDDTSSQSSDKENLNTKQADKLAKKLEREKQKELEKKAKEEEKLAKKRQLEQDKLERKRKIEEERESKKRKLEEEREAKRRKLEEEKELKRKKLEEEKELKRKKLEEEKLLREQKRLEEKLAKEKEREEKKRKLEEEKRIKELERKRIEEEKKKAEELKERSQMKISSFFQVKPAQPKSQEISTTPIVIASSPSEIVCKYDSEFLPFFVQKNVTVMSRPRKDLSQTQKELNDIIANPSQEQFTSFLKSLPMTASTSATHQTTPDEIITALNSSTTTESQVYQLINQLPPIKYISFYENEKPPYIGTWCSTKHKSQQASIIANPLNSELTGFDYDYDSDLEWNKDDEDGEDLDDDVDDDEDDSMLIPDEEDDEFVENDGIRKKKFISLSIINKWNNDENKSFFQDFSVVVMTEGVQVPVEGPIDPFCNYWKGEEVVMAAADESNATLNEQVQAVALSTPVKNTMANPNILTPSKKTITDPIILKSLIQFLEKNNDFTIGTLVELSKKEFKQFTKALLKNTIQDIACYNKKTSIWEIKQEIKTRYE